MHCPNLDSPGAQVGVLALLAVVLIGCCVWIACWGVSNDAAKELIAALSGVLGALYTLMRGNHPPAPPAVPST